MDQDRKFLDTFIIVIGALMAFTVAMYFLANGLAEAYLDVDNSENPIAVQAVANRIEPVGKVLTTDDPQPPASVQAAAAAKENPTEADKPLNGQQVYDQACFACHGTGAAGAPKLGDVPAWSGRIAKGTEMLYQHAINGFTGETGIMPPKGGRTDLSDAQVKAAVDYMISQGQ